MGKGSSKEKIIQNENSQAHAVNPIYANILDKLPKDKKYKILLLGLEGAGKSSILQQLDIGELMTTIPTVGFTVDRATHKNITFISWDIGANTPARHLWRQYYSGTNGMIFVVDSCDKDKVIESKKEFKCLLDKSLLKNVSVLILANKADMTNSMTSANVTEIMDVKAERAWAQSTCATSGTGLNLGLEWLISQIK